MIEALESRSGGAIAEYLSPLPHAISLDISDVVNLSPLAQAKILEQLALNHSGVIDQLEVVEDNSDDLDIAVVLGVTSVQTKAATNNF